MKSLFVSSLIWAATAVLLGLDFISGFIHDEIYYRSLSPQELDRVTGNGVVPGYWILMPFVTVFVIVPVWLVVSSLVLVITRASRNGGQRGLAFLAGPSTALIFLGGLGTVSAVVQLYMALNR